MPRIVPSQVVQYIDRTWPQIVARANEAGDLFLLHADQGPALECLVQLIEAIPDELLPRDPIRFEDVVFSTGTIRQRLAKWNAGVNQAALGTSRGRDRHPVALIFNALTSAPDEAINAGTVELAFITDAYLAASIRQDVSTATSALANGEWKAATVLGGAVVEALLLWILQQASAADLNPVRVALHADGLLINEGSPIDEWSLAAMVRAARALDFIDDEAQRQAVNAQKFRNLIHPGRAQRLNQPCTRGTALATLAAVELVAAALSR
jgi:hypothetical protein